MLWDKCRLYLEFTNITRYSDSGWKWGYILQENECVIKHIIKIGQKVTMNNWLVLALV